MKFKDAIETIEKYLSNNPKNIEVKLMLSEIKRLAAEDYYAQALALLRKVKIKAGKESAKISKAYDSNWYKQKINDDIAEAKKYISSGKDRKAKKLLEIIRHLEPDNPELALFLTYFSEYGEDFSKKSHEAYKNGNYQEAMAMFNFFKLKNPNDKDAMMFYHLACARKYMREVKLEKVKEHLIEALKIAPDEEEVLDTFDRLEDVLEVMQET